MTEPLGAGRPAPSGPRADFWYRLGGFLVDRVIVSIVSQIVGLFFRERLVSLILISYAIDIAYVVFFIGSPSGQTVGMRVLGIRAIDARTGGPVDHGTAFVRYLVALVSLLPCYLGYFWMLWDPERQTWHDKAAHTYVVPVAEFPVKRWPG